MYSGGIGDECRECGDEVLIGVYDEGLGMRFCDVYCQLEFYQKEYDRLVKKSNRWMIACLKERLNDG